MKCGAFVLFLLVSTSCSYAQATPQNISPAKLQTVIDLPLDQAIKLRETYKAPLRAAYDRQMAMAGEDCQAEGKQGQQPYNICMGQVAVEADKDLAIFYNNLQMLCHDRDQLKALQALQAAWQTYRDNAMKAAHAAWPDGTGAPGFAGEVYVSVLRSHMRELYGIYGLNIKQ